jgi:hypothetical protein
MQNAKGRQLFGRIVAQDQLMIEHPKKPDVPRPPGVPDVVDAPSPDINPVPPPDIPPQPLPDRPEPQRDVPGLR